jgi:curved DNA-binding protein CbpA
MRSFEGLNYYQILKIPVNASFIEIKRAYKDALEIYGEGSLATYSLFSDDERVHLLKAIEKAFFTLVDEDKRADYDRMLVDTGQVDASTLTNKIQNKPIPLFNDKNSLNADDLADRIRRKSAEKEVTTLLKEVLGKDLISGDDLKRLRKAFGIEIFEIYLVTKISVSVLRTIEDNQYESLPADAYLNNFLRSYAEILQIDAPKVIDGYFNNMSLARKDD